MAGNRQHFIPRFLMMGFTSKQKKKEFYTYVYLKDSPHYEPNLRNIGLETFFYGKPEESNVDEIITDREEYYSEQINLLRDKTVECQLDGRFESEFIAHIIARSKHLRLLFNELGTESFKAFFEKIDSPQNLYRFLMNIFENKPEIFIDSLKKEMDNNVFSIFSKETKSSLNHYVMSKAPNLFIEFAIKAHGPIQEAQNKINAGMKDLIKKSQLRALSEGGIAPSKIVAELNKMSWSLMITDEDRFILGDVTAFIRHGEGLDFKPYHYFDKQLTQVFLPISSKHMLFGSANDKVQIPTINQINTASASLSHKFFISSSQNQDVKKLSDIISTNATMFDSDLHQKMHNTLDRKLFGY